MPSSHQRASAVEEAVSHVAYALSDVSYLVAPVPFGQALEKYIVSARRNVFDQVGKVNASQVGQELIEKAYAASKRGEFVTLFASSPASLLQMVPTMYKLSAALLPAVVHVVARDHSDLMAVRQTGFVILHSLNAEETPDMALLAHVASVRANVPFLHVYDGDMAQNDLEQRVAQGPHQKFTNSLVTYKKLAELIGLKNAASASEFRQLVLSNSAIKPAISSGEDGEDAAATSDADLYFQVSPETVQKYNAVPAVLEQVIAEVFTGKGYQLFEYFGHPQAEHVLVVMGTASSVVKDAVESLFTNWNAKVGVVSVRLFRPWSTKAFLSVIPAAATNIAVLDRMDDATNVGEPLFLDVLASFQSEEWSDKATPTIIGGKYACHAHDQVFDVVTARTLVEGLAAGELQHGFTIASSPSEEQVQAKQLVSGYVSSSDGFEAPYVKMLLQLFEQRAVIANLVRKTTIWKDNDDSKDSVPLESGEFGFGVHLGILAKRQQLKDTVNALLKDAAAASALSQRLVECLRQWASKQPKHDALANEIVILLENEQHKRGLVSEIYALKKYFSPLSQWIIGSEEFSRDVGASGVHQVLASGENVNLLILDTEPIHSTFPRVADIMGFCTPEQAKDVAEKVMILQRDFGDRVNRKHARFKYTVEDHGLAWIRSEVENRLGWKLQEARPFTFDSNGDRFGWHKLSNGKFAYTMFIEGGRIKDTNECKLRTGMRELAKAFPDVEFQLTGNQNMSLANITNDQIGPIKALMEKYGFGNENYSAMRLNSIACAALPFCGLAFSEAERYLPVLITKIEDILLANGLRDDAIVIRMTGCPNGCGRPYLGEIGFVGRAPGIYNLYLGAGFAGDRLNKLYKEAVDEEQILAELAPIIKNYAENRNPNEKFGDFVIRQGYVKACLAAPLVENRAAGETFHEQ
uniref:assimilatory sulfite reductase (NADPH) n=1 Tax=Globisporangium ultimum (strain ATCC 200006 / CBS 805.95 / DAOM BR144) TaxID=431595 RepID=K3X0T0_GLOUD